MKAVKTKPYSSIKVCNCISTMSCDHDVSILNDQNPNIIKNTSKSKPCTKAMTKDSDIQGSSLTSVQHNKNKLDTCPELVNNSVSSVSVVASVEQENIAIPNTAAATDANRELSNTNKQRWNFDGSFNSQNAFSAMGVSRLLQCDVEFKCKDSSHGNSDAESKIYTSLVCPRVMQGADFFVYKKRRLDYPKGPNYFEKTNNEIVLEVFKWLPKTTLIRCAQVCKRFYRLALDFSLWRRLDLSGRVMPPGSVGRVLMRGCQYLRLSKAELPDTVFSPGLEHLPKFQTSLLYLDMSMAVCSTESLLTLLKVCTTLKKVSFEFLTLSQEVLSTLARNRQLDTLNLSMCSGLTDHGMIELLSCCNRLQHLNLAWCSGFTRYTLSAIITNLPSSIQRLSLAGYRHHMTDPLVAALVERVPGLVELDISDSTDITQYSMQLIVNGLKNLQSLSLSRCYNLPCTCFHELVKLPHLTQLTVHGVLGDSTVASLRSRMPEVHVNKHLFCTIARPTVGVRRTSIWLARVRDT